MTRKRRGCAPIPEYPKFFKLDGDHPYKREVPDGHVPYRARRVRGAQVVYFNFALAREMGLIGARHPDRLNAKLRRSIVDTFGLRIINEYDLLSGVRVPPRDRLDGSYMATRYLALQHPGRTGKTSGDGRSIWNGTVTHRGVTWDVTSCGTGVTKLCPATAESDRYYKTGNWRTDYGCGTSTVLEGLVSTLMSETFARNEIATERVLAVLELPDGFGITVRAGCNLLRPSHFFVHLKQARLASLAAAIDCFIERETENGRFPRLDLPAERYRHLAAYIADTFARVAATFEREYIFCWLDWDGDNILADGGIIDYGSVRQFGLYHREYRFDDGPRWSTTLPEQRRKARQIVRTFAQIRDYLLTGRKPALASLSRDPVLRRFDHGFARTRDALLLRDVGFDRAAADALHARAPRQVEAFRRVHHWFERSRSARGPHHVGDGISWNAIFSTRDLLRELPGRLLAGGAELPPELLIEIALSTFATHRDRAMTPQRIRQAIRFRQAYRGLIETAARLTGRSVPLVLADVAARAAILNRYDRITGDGILHAAERLHRGRRRLGPEGVYAVVDGVARYQTRLPERAAPADARPPRVAGAERIFDGIVELLADCRHGL
ncbi:MAG TPA: hypothetical protein VD788_11060 [Candidatus Polarisedimenticolaceae bacterium]|nr:hypothetical protein [Candidatus Polarisedimenticolaceae bacterium]